MNINLYLLERSLEIHNTFRGKKKRKQADDSSELRLDSNDMNGYTLAQFQDFYGESKGAKLFAQAPIYVPEKSCFCGREDYTDVGFIQCVVCNRWCHYSCAGVTEESAKDIDYVCIPCLREKEQAEAAKKENEKEAVAKEENEEEAAAKEEEEDKKKPIPEQIMITQGVTTQDLTISDRWNMSKTVGFVSFEDIPGHTWVRLNNNKISHNDHMLCTLDFISRNGVGGFPINPEQARVVILTHAIKEGKLNAQNEEIYETKLHTDKEDLDIIDIAIFVHRKKLNCAYFTKNLNNSPKIICKSDDFTNWVFLQRVGKLIHILCQRNGDKYKVIFTPEEEKILLEPYKKPIFGMDLSEINPVDTLEFDD